MVSRAPRGPQAIQGARTTSHGRRSPATLPGMPRLSFASAAVIAGAVGACGGGRPAERPPNVLLVVVDTLRADHVGANGYALSTTPEIDRLAARGAVFTQAIAQSSWTRPSMATLMTGLHPTSVGLTCHEFRVPEGACDVLPDEAPTLAELLAGAGYARAGVIANINVDPVFGFHQGFEDYVSVPALLAGDEEDWRHGNEWLRESTEAVTRHALEWLADRGDDDTPFLLYLHYLDPHAPYEPPERLAAGFPPDGYPRDPDTNALLARYDAEIRLVDEGVGAVLAGLEAAGEAERTLVVVVSDHGEEFRDHGGLEHGWTMFDEQVRVPLIVAGPGVSPRRIDRQVRVLDVLPTISELALGTVPAWTEGLSLVPLLEGRDLDLPGALSERGYEPLTSWRDPPWKLVLDEASGTAVLYDLAADPGETTDVAAAHPEVVAELRGRLEALRERCEAAAERFSGGDGELHLSPEQIRALEAIGYTDG